jgi:hypothetical protein
MKRFFLLWTLILTFTGLTLGLTPNERKAVQLAQQELRQGQADYAAAKAALAAADQRAADAQVHAATTDQKLGEAQKQFDTVNKDNVRMKPVYDQCTSKWGIGAIIFGVKDLAKHLMWVAIGGVALIIALYALSFAFPIFGVILAAVVRFFTMIFHGINAALRALEAHLKPTPPAPPKL